MEAGKMKMIKKNESLSDVRIKIGTSGISTSDLKGMGMVGRIMFEVLCFAEAGCKVEAKRELLEHTARGILEIVESLNADHTLTEIQTKPVKHPRILKVLICVALDKSMPLSVCLVKTDGVLKYTILTNPGRVIVGDYTSNYIRLKSSRGLFKALRYWRDKVQYLCSGR